MMNQINARKKETRPDGEKRRMRERERKKKEDIKLWVFACRGRRANRGMVENSNVSVSVSSVCAELTAQNILPRVWS